MTKLYVGNLPYSVTNDTLSELFAAYAPLGEVIVITDRASGRSKGFGFVEIEDDAKATQAIEEMDNKEVEGRNLKVSVARPMRE